MRKRELHKYLGKTNMAKSCSYYRMLSIPLLGICLLSIFYVCYVDNKYCRVVGHHNFEWSDFDHHRLSVTYTKETNLSISCFKICHCMSSKQVPWWSSICNWVIISMHIVISQSQCNYFSLSHFRITRCRKTGTKAMTIDQLPIN